MELSVDTKALSEATREVMGISELFKRAERSALKSVGFMVRGEMRDFVESGGGGSWAGLHPVSRSFSKKYKTGASKWFRSKKATGPMHWLGKFSRYRVTDDASIIGFGKSHGSGASQSERESPATISPFLMSVLRRSEQGESTAVTPAMRRFFGGTRFSNSKAQAAGDTFFPLRKDTKTLDTPKRPIFDPVMARVQGMITPHFEDKFWLAIERYRTGVKNKK